MDLRKFIEKQFKVKTEKEVAERYKDSEIVSMYISKRFEEPIGKLKHNKQIKMIDTFLGKEDINKVLEIACGPARLTADLHGDFKGVATDNSGEMLKVANKRMSLAKNKNWSLEKANVFEKNHELKNFDLVLTFRFLRHLQLPKRETVYSNIRNSLRKDGIFIFDVLNARKTKWIKLVGKRKIVTFDQLYYKDEIISELEENGFEVIDMAPVINHFFTQYSISKMSYLIGLKKIGYKLVSSLERLGSKNNPWEWVIVCQKK